MATSKTKDYEVDIKDLCRAFEEMIAWATDIRQVLCSAKPGSKIIVPMGPPRGDNPRYYGNCPPPEGDSNTPIAAKGPVSTDPGPDFPKWADGCPNPVAEPATKAGKKKPAGKTKPPVKSPRGKKQA
jgi:hypothetical protein